MQVAAQRGRAAPCPPAVSGPACSPRAWPAARAPRRGPPRRSPRPCSAPMPGSSVRVPASTARGDLARPAAAGSSAAALRNAWTRRVSSRPRSSRNAIRRSAATGPPRRTTGPAASSGSSPAGTGSRVFSRPHPVHSIVAGQRLAALPAGAGSTASPQRPSRRPPVVHRRPERLSTALSTGRGGRPAAFALTPPRPPPSVLRRRGPRPPDDVRKGKASGARHLGPRLATSEIPRSRTWLSGR